VTVERTHAVLGLGGIGSAAAYWLARRSSGDVIGLEQFEIGHTRGASEDHSRIIRRSYHTPGYVALADAAYRTWEEVEAELGEPLIVRTGGLDLWPDGAAIPMDDYTSSLRACSVEFEELDATEVMRRWPQWRLGRGVRALFQSDGGIVPASRCNAAHRSLAERHGATLRDRAPVTAIRDAGKEIELSVDGGDRVRCSTLVIAADAWTNEVLAMLDADPLPLTLTKEQVVYFGCLNPGAFAPQRFPIWIWMDDPSFYGFPSFGEPAPKVAQDVGGPEIAGPEERGDEPDPAALERVTRFMERHLPAAAGPVRRLRTCVYTMPPDRDFVLGPVPGHPRVFVALGAAHGFKFSSLFGKILADLAIDGATEHDLSPFAPDRPLLQMANPPRSFLI
jgi:sarcosine oxidase